MIKDRPTVPATARESIACGKRVIPAARIASEIPGTDLSMTSLVASGVWSRGDSPVPPVVTTTPWNPSTARANALPTLARPSATTTDSTTSHAARSNSSTTAGPDSSSPPTATESETVTTLASSFIAGRPLLALVRSELAPQHPDRQRRTQRFQQPKYRPPPQRRWRS